MSNHILEINGVSKSFPGVKALDAEHLGDRMNELSHFCIQDCDHNIAFTYDNLEKLFAEKEELLGPVPLESEEYTTFSDWVNMWEEVKATK